MPIASMQTYAMPAFMTSMMAGLDGVNDPDQSTIDQIAKDFDVRPQPLQIAVDDMHSALNPPDAEEISKAVTEITRALSNKNPPDLQSENSEGNAQESETFDRGTGDDFARNDSEPNEPSFAQYAEQQWLSTSDGAAAIMLPPEPPATIDGRIEELRHHIVQLGIPIAQIEQIVDAMRPQMEAQLADEKAAYEEALSQQQAQEAEAEQAAEALAQEQATQTQSQQPMQNDGTDDAGRFDDGSSDDSPQLIGGVAKSFNVAPAMNNVGGGANLIDGNTYAYEGSYSDPNIKTPFIRGNTAIDPATNSARVSFANGSGGSFISQTPTGPGTISFNFTTHTQGPVVAGGVFAFKAGQGEYDIGELGLNKARPRNMTVGVWNHKTGQKVYDHEVSPEEFGHTDGKFPDNMRVEAHISRGSYKVFYENAQGQMQEAGSHDDDGTIYDQMYNTGPDSNPGGPPEGVKWQANIWGFDGSGSGDMTISDLQAN